MNLPKIKLSDYNKIHRDFRGVWTNPDMPQYIGKRAYMTNIDGATVLLIEDFHFKIINL